jgi:hypothetical protein
MAEEPTPAWIYVEQQNKWYEGAVGPGGAYFKDRPDGVKKGMTVYAFARTEGEPVPTGDQAAAMIAEARIMAGGGVNPN